MANRCGWRVLGGVLVQLLVEADLFVIDDPHSEQDALSELHLTMRMNGTLYPRQRLQPGGSIIIMTRWGKKT